MRYPLVAGSFYPSSKAALIKEVDGFLENVKKSIEALMESNIDYEFRTTVVPTIHDLEDIKQVSSSLSGCRKYVLQKFDVSLGKETLNPEFMKLKPFTDEEMEKFLAAVQKLIPAAKLR